MMLVQMSPRARVRTILAITDQQEIIRRHITRLTELKMERFEAGTFEWLTAHLEIERWQLVEQVLTANMSGKTVQPS